MKIVKREVALKKKKQKGKKTLEEKIQFGLWSKFQDKIISPSCGVYNIEYNSGLQVAIYRSLAFKPCPATASRQLRLLLSTFYFTSFSFSLLLMLYFRSQNCTPFMKNK